MIHYAGLGTIGLFGRPDWAGLRHPVLCWVGQGGAGLGWAGLGWAGMEWNGMEWNGMEWNEVYSAWIGLGHTGLIYGTLNSIELSVCYN